MKGKVLLTVSVITALWLLSRSIGRRKKSKSKSVPHEVSPSHSGTDSRGFDVFLNFRGPDSRHTVADILYDTLTRAGIRVFLDDEEIRKGEVIEGELLGAITNSRIYIPIFSKGYASSKWCLRELTKMMDCWQHSSGQAKKVIFPIFYDVSVSKDIKLRSQVYTTALQKHKKELGEVIVKPWEDALQKVAGIKGWNVQDHGLSKLANLIKKRVLSDINANEAVSNVPDRLVGIHGMMEEIMHLLEDGSADVRFIVIHGMGGIGKTTLAEAVFNNISSNFHGSCILRDVRRSSTVYDIVKLQEKLLLDTLSLKSIEVLNIDDGIRKISGRLRNQNVLVVLDDVDKREHLLSLAAKSNWFGPKSRIIITTRNIEFLPTRDNNEYCFYEMKGMNHDHALQLFCRHAFSNDHPPREYHDISVAIVATTGRLPLALQVIGSSLYNQDLETWMVRLDKLKKAPYKDVQETLMISYQALEYEQQQIFLDIACFFNGEKMTNPIHFWEACKFHPNSAIKVLVHRSLIKVNEDEKLWMHDQLRDLGKVIAQPRTQDHKNQIPAKPSRLWSPEVALDLVHKKEVAESIVALKLGKLDDGYCFGREEFVKAVNLMLLEVQGGNFEGDFTNVFDQLRWLSWFDCPSEIKATNLIFTNLVVIKLSRSKMTKDWTGWDAITVAKQLKVMDVRECFYLTNTPNFSSLLRLERLIFINCGLKEIDSSIDKLKHLDYLEISMGFSTAEPFLLPASIGGLKSLTKLIVAHTGLTYLNPSIGELTSLEKLDIYEQRLEELPDSIGNLRQLKIFKIDGCPVTFLPDSIGRLESLNELDLNDAGIIRLPESIGNLKKLKVINMSGSKMEELPKALGELENLEELDASCCEYMVGELPEEIGRLTHLRILKLDGSKFTRLPGSIKQLFNLQILLIDGIQELPRLPTSLAVLEVSFKPKESPRLYDLSYLTNLLSLSLRNRTPHGQSHRASQLHVETTRIDWLTRLQKLENLILMFDNFVNFEFPPTDLSSLYRLRTLRITCLQPRSLTHLPSSLEHLTLDGVTSPVNWQLLSGLNKLSTLTFTNCWLKEIIVDSLGHIHSLSLCGCESVARLSNLSYLKELRELVLHNCPKVVDIEGLGGLEFLRYLTMQQCGSIQRLPDLSRSKKLEELLFGSCESLEYIPSINEEAQCHLRVYNCRHLRPFEGPYSNYHCTKALG